MAIVIKVKADTKELEKDLKQASENVQKSINVKTAPLTEEFNRLRTAGQAARVRIEEVRNSTVGLNAAALATKLSITALTAAVVGATTAFIRFGLEGSKLADTLLETAFAAGKTVEQMQKLEKGGRDLTPRLKELGGVLDFEMIQKASKATDEFAIFAKQLDAVKILVAGDMANAFTLLGRTMNNTLAAGAPIIRGLASVAAQAIEEINPLITKLAQASLLILEFEARKARGFGAAATTTPTFAPSPVGAFGPALTAEQIAFSTSPQGLKIAQQQLDAQAARERQAARLKLASTRTRRARAVREVLPREAVIDQQTIERFSDLTAGNFGIGAAEGMFKLREELDKTAFETQKFALQFEDFKKRGLQGSREALELLTKWQVAYNQNLNVERELKQQLATVAALPAAQQRNLPLAISGVSPVAPGTGIPGATVTGAFEAFGPIATQAKENAQRLFDEVRQQAIRFKEGIVFTFESAFREGFERGPKAFLQATAGAIKSFFSQIAAELSTGIIELILFGKGGMSGRGIGTTGQLGGLRAALGGFGGAVGGGGGGGGLGGLIGGFGGGGGGGGGIGGFISSFLGGGGGGGAGIGVASSLSGALGGYPGPFSSVSNAVSQGIAGTGAVGGGLVAGLGAFVGTGLVGGLLGSGLGGKSTAGKILGGIGGGILGAGGGILGFTALGGVISGTGLGTAGLAAIGLLTNPFTLAIGGALLLGAYLLGKSKQRRDDEKLADSIWVEEREQVRQLIQAVNADRIDGGAALAQAQALRGQTVAQLSQIKTKSVRESRMSNQLRDLDNGVIAELRAAVERQARRRGVQGGLVPEFAGGGYVQGVDRGYDSVLARVRPGEVILNKQQQSMVQSRAGYRIFEDVGIQQFQNGGRVSPAPAAAQSLHVNIVVEGDAQAVLGNLIVRGVETSSGQRAIVSVIKNGRKNGDL